MEAIMINIGSLPENGLNWIFVFSYFVNVWRCDYVFEPLQPYTHFHLTLHMLHRHRRSCCINGLVSPVRLFACTHTSISLAQVRGLKLDRWCIVFWFIYVKRCGGPQYRAIRRICQSNRWDFGCVYVYECVCVCVGMLDCDTIGLRPLQWRW